MPERIPNDVIRDAHQRYLKLGSLNKTAEEYGTTGATLSRRFSQMGLKLNPRGRKKGSKNRTETFHVSSKADGWLVHLDGGEYGGAKFIVEKLGDRLVLDLPGGKRDLYEWSGKDDAKKTATAQFIERLEP